MSPEEIVKLAKKAYLAGAKSCIGHLGIVWDDGHWKAGGLGCCGIGAAVIGAAAPFHSDVCGILGITDDQFKSFTFGFDRVLTGPADEEWKEWESAGSSLRDWTIDNGI